MILSWSLRLLCLLLIVFGLLLIALQLTLARCAPIILRHLESAPARRRERALYRIQLFPALTALFMTASVCLPAYLRFEPTHEPEKVSGLCVLLASAVGLWIASTVLRGLRIVLRTLRFTSACRRSGQLLQRCGSTPVFAVTRTAHPVALLGFRSPLIVLSSDLLAENRLRDDALAVALDHERSHAIHGDNWKLLSLCFLPHLLLPGGDLWQRAWRAAADWAADDDAVHGDTNRSLLLAEAIVRTARVARSVGHPAVIHTALTSAEAGIATRIDRLLHPQPTVAQPCSFLPGVSAIILLATIAAVAASPWIYSLSESLLHLGRF